MESLRAVAAPIVDMGMQAAPFFMGPLSIPAKISLGFQGGVAGDMLSQLIAPPRNELDIEKTLQTGQTQIRESNELDPDSPIISGVINAAAVPLLMGGGKPPSFSAKQGVPKATTMFEMGSPRTSGRGGIAKQRTSIETVQADLAEAFKEGLNPNEKLPFSQRIAEPIKRTRSDLHSLEVELVDRIPGQQVELSANEAQKILRYGGELGVEGKYASVKSLGEDGGRLTARDAKALLDELNADVEPYFKSTANRTIAPSPEAKARLSELNAIRKNLRNRYIETTEKFGIGGIKDMRLRQGALKSLEEDIAANKNRLDRQPEGFWKRMTQHRHHSATGTFMDNVFALLKKNPADYVAGAAREWGEAGLQPKLPSFNANQYNKSIFTPPEPRQLPYPTSGPDLPPSGNIFQMGPTPPGITLGPEGAISKRVSPPFNYNRPAQGPELNPAGFSKKKKRK
jgi:hypothetical protein